MAARPHGRTEEDSALHQVKVFLPVRRNPKKDCPASHVVATLVGSCGYLLSYKQLREVIFDALRALIVEKECANEDLEVLWSRSNTPKISGGGDGPSAEGVKVEEGEEEDRTPAPLQPPPLPGARVEGSGEQVGGGGRALITIAVSGGDREAGSPALQVAWEFDESFLREEGSHGPLEDSGNGEHHRHFQELKEVADKGPECYVLASCPTPTFPPDGIGADFKQDSGQVFTSAARINGLPLIEGHKVLHLAPAYLMPPPPIIVEVVGSSKHTDAFSKDYTSYDMKVKHGFLEWSLSKRFSEFAALHEKLLSGGGDSGTSTGAIDRAKLPRLPSKMVRQSDDVIHAREEQLERYLRDLVLLPEALLNVHVLSFLGLMSTARVDLPRMTALTEGETKPRQVVHLSALRKHLQWGDIILFKCANSISHLQRTVTGAEWDHVALVVKKDRLGHNLELLESTADGVTCYPLTTRIRAYSGEFTAYMAVRKLQAPRDAAMEERMRRFVQRVDGMPYGFHLKVLFSKKKQSITPPPIVQQKPGQGNNASSSSDDVPPPSSSTSTSPTTSSTITVGGEKTTTAASLMATTVSRAASPLPPPPAPPAASAGEGDKGSIIPQRADKDSFFCSELVTEGLREMGVLQADVNCSYFWPGSFTKGGEIETALEPGCSLSDIVLIDCKVVEVARAMVMVNSSPRGVVDALTMRGRGRGGAEGGGGGGGINGDGQQQQQPPGKEGGK